MNVVRYLPPELRKLAPGQRRVIVGIALAAFLLRLFFWWYTGRTWEDALITVLHSENAGRGLGLTHFHPGMPPVHGFTSPLGVLIPLMADIFHPGWGLILLKVVSALLSVPTVLLAAAIALRQEFRVNVWLVYLLCSYLAFEHHQILWGMSGMETQAAVFALFLAMYQALRLKPLALGLSMALCMYARPDFAIFLLVIALYLYLSDRRVLAISTLVAGAAYAPWLIFTTLYYGSPVPHSMLAKHLGYQLWTRTVPLFSQSFITHIWERLYGEIFMPLGPSFAGHGGDFAPFMDEALIARCTLLILLLGAFAMLREFRRFYLVPLGALAAYSLYFIFFVPDLFGWYLVPFSAVNCLLLVLGLSVVFRTFAMPDRIAVLSRAACLAYILPFLIVLPITFRAEKDIQRYIEIPVFKAMGEYLFSHKTPGDTLGCEPLGSTAYYSHMPVYDYPGLANSEVTDFLKQNPNRRSLDWVLAHFRPNWIALRGYEYDSVAGLPHMRFLDTEYTRAAIFEADPRNARSIFRIKYNVDRKFLLFHKNR